MELYLFFFCVDRGGEDLGEGKKKKRHQNEEENSFFSFVISSCRFPVARAKGTRARKGEKEKKQERQEKSKIASRLPR